MNKQRNKPPTREERHAVRREVQLMLQRGIAGSEYWKESERWDNDPPFALSIGKVRRVVRPILDELEGEERLVAEAWFARPGSWELEGAIKLEVEFAVGILRVRPVDDPNSE